MPFYTLRFNHSCMANAEFHWNPVLKRQEVRAIKKIKPEAEITLCYVTGRPCKKTCEKNLVLRLPKDCMVVLYQKMHVSLRLGDPREIRSR